MNRNVGNVDRVFRVVLGFALILIGVYLAGTKGIILGVIGLIPLLSGLAGRCPAYSLFKISTCKSEHVLRGHP